MPGSTAGQRLPEARRYVCGISRAGKSTVNFAPGSSKNVQTLTIDVESLLRLSLNMVGNGFSVMNKIMKHYQILMTLLSAITMAFSAQADERRFTYTYEPEVLPQG